MADKAISFEQMCKKQLWEESEIPYYKPPLINSYEAKIPGGDGFNQSGFFTEKGHK